MICESIDLLKLQNLFLYAKHRYKLPILALANSLRLLKNTYITKNATHILIFT